MTKKKILIVEDDADLREGLTLSFESDGYQVRGAGNKREGLCRIREGSYDLVLLDCNLPDGTGFELCREVRSFDLIPIIMLTARDTELDEIKALELGVDDYLSKPFSLGVLKARVRRLIEERPEMTELVSGDLTVDLKTCRVCRGGEEIALSRIEYRMLCYLIENKNHVLSKEQILDHIWDQDGRYVDDNTVSVNISRLRTKIGEDGADRRYIQTVHGIGYIWKEE